MGKFIKIQIKDWEGLSLRKDLKFKVVGKKFSWLQEVQQKVNVQEIKDLSRSLYSPSNLKK